MAENNGLNYLNEMNTIELEGNEKLFTMDAKSMYTNIHLKHALPIIIDFLTKNEMGIKIRKKETIRVAALEYALETIMNNNIFMFGDTYWIQRTGTAMGTPPAPEYATLYFAIKEIETIQKYPELKYYSRYIDDGIGIWHPKTSEADDEHRWKIFRDEINNYGTTHSFFKNSQHKPLEWEFSKRDESAIFLDLNITIKNRKIVTRIYEKEMNLHLYIPPHSCHSPGTTKSLIYGAIKRASRLCTNKEDAIPYIIKTVDRLVARGHKFETIKKMTIEAIKNTRATCNKQQKRNTTPSMFLHLPYNPADPSARIIQEAFNKKIIHPEQASHIKNIQPVAFERLTICYHSQKKLSVALAPRKYRLGGNLISNFLKNIKENSKEATRETK